MERIFISYRRDDTKHFSARIHDRLVREFGKDNVFFDVDNNIPAGSTWQNVLQNALEQSDVLLVIIGDKWEGIINERNEGSDWVRFEVEHGLKRDDMLVVPVLIEDTEVPKVLPESIMQLTDKQIFNLRHDPYFNTGMQQLSQDIRQWRRSERSGFSFIPILGVMLSLLIIVILMTQFTDFFTDGGNEPEQTESIAPVIETQAVDTEIPINTAIPPIIEIEHAWNFEGELNSDWQPYIHTFGDGHEMALVPVGCFMMGSNDEQMEYAFELGANSFNRNEQPVNQQCIEEPFWIDVTEITNAEYGSVGCNEASTEPNQPRNCVDWVDSLGYCEARDGSLPTELQWEYAARGVESWIFPWGDDENRDYANSAYVGTEETMIVGSYPDAVSWVGALDMAGNLWEWTSTILEIYPYDEDDGRENLDNSVLQRATHGGSFLNTFSHMRSAARADGRPSLENSSTGFRCVLPIDAAQ